MKKVLMSVSLFCATILMAGGDLLPDISYVAEIDDKTCENNTVYKEGHTNLMWQDEAYTDAEDGAYKNNQSTGKAGSWHHAENYCLMLDYAGYMDWRLPTADELSHVHRKRGQSFVNFRGSHFWSSTPTVEKKYYVVYTPDAYQYKRKKRESHYVRCVRCYK